MTFSLPEDLPSGRGVPVGSPVMWYADKMPYAPLLDVWTRAQRQQDTTGLRPILCYADDDRPRSLDLAEIAAVDPPTPFPEYAASLVDAPLWRFWWD
ncbi:hypothetical protein OG780_24520 [Streptomyces sp. NBC_00386]|uniref:hypothetical protein n=1 Tax=Streptomyces sp. NBC_00386 TaxID=2975734 RepID=UPI002E1EDA20